MHDRLQYDVPTLTVIRAIHTQPEDGGDTVVVFVSEASSRLSEETLKDAPYWQLTAHDGTG